MKAINKLKEKALQDLKSKYPNVPDHAISKKKYTDKNTNGLTKAIIDWIQLNGYQAERINSTGRRIDNRRTVRDVIGRQRTIGSVKWIKGNTQTGTADVSATINGKSVKIEVKCSATGDKYLSKDQKAYRDKIIEAGGVYVIARDFQSFYDWYNEFIK